MTTIRTDAERHAEIEDRLYRMGIRPCRCGDDCRAYRYQYNHVKAGLRGADLGVPAMGGEAVAASMGTHPDGRSRYAAKRGRDAAQARQTHT